LGGTQKSLPIQTGKGLSAPGISLKTSQGYLKSASLSL
jgi:hypothetical protein